MQAVTTIPRNQKRLCELALGDYAADLVAILADGHDGSCWT